LGDPELELSGVSHDSSRVQAGELFACLPGHKADSRAFIPAALARGASAVLLEPPPYDQVATQILVPSVREALPRVARELYGSPQGRPVVGITGTNGKTTTAYLISAVLTAAGETPALLGSVESKVGSRSFGSEHTTPEASTLHAFWRLAETAGATALVLEVSSHGLLLHRTDGLEFSVAVFTNLTRDHLDYHPDPAAYRGAKSRLFGQLPRQGTAVLNRDDPAWQDFARATGARVLTYGTTAEADVHPRALRVDAAGIELEIESPGARWVVTSPLFGRFNVANLLAAAAAALALKLEPAVIATGLAAVTGVPGRAERIDCGQPFVVLNDFAHTPDALARILDAARELTHGSLHVVFGCGGDRDTGKRPHMGRVALERADRVTVTSDNPRTEDPRAIIAQIVAGLEPGERLRIESDRRTAIGRALAEQRATDTLVVAGKGHERYQIIGTTRHRFDDAEVIREELAGLGFA
jgi:UDP-N-acetylmuramoyl-L-alanyl-D-glutamate--2,6-diaminopimelate ligase